MYGPPDEAECIATIQRALDLGANLLDTAEMYGPFHNESLVGRALVGRREHAVVSTKFGFRYDLNGNLADTDSSPAHVKRSVDGSLARLGIDCIDLLYQHRIDRKVPIEDTVGAMSDLVREGKVRYLGLSEVSVQTIRRAHAVHPLSAVETEYSPWEREPEQAVLPVLRELGIGFVAYSPLGRGFLAGSAPREQVDKDARSAYPRFQGENYDRNAVLARRLHDFAAQRGLTASQLALGWLLAMSPDIVPIPGTKRRRWLEENVQAAEVVLDDHAMAWFEAVFPIGVAAGERYNPALYAYVDR